MDTRQLEYILAIAETRSLSRAADKLFLSQSALSQQLAKLKAEGLPPLFYRHKGEMQLTDAGKIYINGARIILKICRDTEELLHQQEGDHMGHLRLAVSRRLQSAVSTTLLPWLKHTYPHLDVLLSTTIGGKMRPAVEHGEIDLAVFSAIRSADEVVDYTILREEELVLVAPLNTEDADLPVTLPSQDTHLRSVCDYFFHTMGLQRPIYAQLDDETTVLKLVAQGECVALLPYHQDLDGPFQITHFPTPVRFYTVAASRHGNESPLVHAAKEQLKAIFS